MIKNSKLWFGYVLFVALFALASYGTLFDYLQQGILFARTAPGGALISDFVNTYVSAKLSRACVESKDARPEVYDRLLQDRTLRPLVAPVVPGQPFYTQYPPYYFALVLPLAWLTMTQAWFVFAAIGLIGAGLSFKYAAVQILVASPESLSNMEVDASKAAGSGGASTPSETQCATVESATTPVESMSTTDAGRGGGSPRSGIITPNVTDPLDQLYADPVKRRRLVTAVCVILGLSTYPMWLSVELGQQALLFFPLLTAFWYLIQKKRFWLAGVVAAFAAIKLQYLPALGIIGLVAGGWQFVLGCALTLVVLILYSGAILGWHNIVHYPQALFSGESGAGVSGVNVDVMQNLRGQLYLFVHGDTQMVHLVSAAAFVVSLGLLAWVWRQYAVATRSGAGAEQNLSDADQTQRFNFTVALSILLMVMFSLHAHSQDYLYVSMACIWLWHFAKTQIKAGNQGSAVVWIRRLSIGFPLISWLMLFLIPLAPLTRVQPFFALAAVLAVCCFSQLRLLRR